MQYGHTNTMAPLHSALSVQEIIEKILTVWAQFHREPGS